MKKVFTIRVLKWLALGCVPALAAVIAGCQGNQTKIDLPSPTGAPAYLLSVDEKSNVNIFSPKGEPWQECSSRACRAMIQADEKAIKQGFESSKATGGFVLLSFEEMKTAGIINVSLFPKAHAQVECMPIGIFPKGASFRVI
ncbi:MAG TPA: hypothetical protein VIC26_01140, partial [Marinagarivorans sp.]